MSIGSLRSSRLSRVDSAPLDPRQSLMAAAVKGGLVGLLLWMGASKVGVFYCSEVLLLLKLGKTKNLLLKWVPQFFQNVDRVSYFVE